MTRADYRALSRFRFLIRRFIHFSEEAARAEGLEPQQHQILLAIQGLDEPEGPTIGQLADHLLIRHHSAVGLVDRLSARGLIERVRGANDRRQVRVRLAPEGTARLRRLSRRHREELRQSGPRLVEALEAVIHEVPATATR